MGRKTTVCGYFKQQTSNIGLKKTWSWLRIGNLKRETETLLITAQNNLSRTKYVESKIGDLQVYIMRWQKQYDKSSSKRL